MRIKDKKDTTKNKVVFMPDGKRVIAICDTSKFTKDDGTEYYSWKIGTFVYLFDDPQPRSKNYVLVRYKKGEKLMKIGEFCLHLIYWRANVLFKLPIDEEHIWNFSEKMKKSMFSDTIEQITRELIDMKDGATPQICDCIAEIKEDLSTLSTSWSSVQCGTISNYDIIQFKNRNKEFNRLLNTRLDKTKTIRETELLMKQSNEDLTKVISADNETYLKPYVQAGRLKIDQLTKVLVAVGTRPDMDKTILPWPIERGYIHGLQNAAEYFMEAITARDAMMTKNESVPRSGFLSRQINRLTGTVDINYKVKDCGTKNFLNYKVENADYLKMAEGKFYVSDNGSLKELSSKDTHLVGKTIKLRSFITCCCKEGVCKTCVGTVSRRLRGTRIGTLPSIKSINPLSQKAMSAKHDLGTKSIEITNETLKKYFYSDGVDFYMNEECAVARDMYIVVDSDDIDDVVNSGVDTDDTSIDSTIVLNTVFLRNHGVDYPIENEGLRIALSDTVLENKKFFIDDPENQDLTLIPVNKLDLSSPVFSAIFDTEEISKYLNSFIAIVDRLTINRFPTYHDLMAEMNKTIYESGFINRIIHFESIIYSMVRDVKDATSRPDFTIEDVPYQILKVSTAIEKKDTYTALSYQGLRRLFKDITLRRRYGKSLYDAFFRTSPLY